MGILVSSSSTFPLPFIQMIRGASRLFSTSGVAQKTADVTIVGAGIMGLCVAYQLKQRDPGMKVTLLERAAGLGVGSSGYSTGFCRAYYNLDETMRLALDGIGAYHNWQEFVREKEVCAKFHRTDALWMMGSTKEHNIKMKARMQRFGVEADVLDEDEISRRFPLIATEPYPMINEEGDEVEQHLPELSAVHEHGCGYLDPTACLRDLLSACRRVDVDVHFNTRVDGFLVQGGAVKGVSSSQGPFKKVSSGVVVNCSGPWFQALNDSVGLTLSTRCVPIRIQVAHKSVPETFMNLPFICDLWGASGVYMVPRRESGQMLFGSIDHRYETEEVDPDECNPSLDPDLKQAYVSALAHRIPSLPQSGAIMGYSSMYTVNQDDLHPVVGETSVTGLWACNGFSGHGFKLAPAIGSMVAQQITGLKRHGLGETDVPLNYLAPDRKPLRALGDSGGSVLA